MVVLDPIAWSIVLMFVGCALVVAEVFVPSGGVLGFLATVSVIAAIVLAFYHYEAWVGFTFVLVAVVCLPVSVGLAFKHWPNTPMGRRFLLGLPTSDEVMPDDIGGRKELIDKIGTAKTPMLLSGAISIDGKTIDAISQGMPIEAGQRVIVVEVKANRVVVRPVGEGDPMENQDPNDVLSQPLDALGLDSLEDPLT